MQLLIGRLKKLDEVTAQIIPLKEITYGQFKEFLDSLDEEMKTWSLDLQHHFKNDKEFYESASYMLASVCVYDKKVIGLCSCYKHDKLPQVIEVSFVVKKDYQSQGIGSTLLKRVEWDAKRHYGIKYITAKHYKDNIASHKAFLKIGYREWREDWMEDNDLDWKIKDIG